MACWIPGPFGPKPTQQPLPESPHQAAIADEPKPKRRSAKESETNG